ncbi:CHAT domain-containing protein [Streptomyces thermolilacinus]|uniref:CHAT domain-containing protein n=1 Tax=Streptomyces thermolilacinus TaxID=285540 RepID=UPI001F3CBDC6|nr:CHAT domain-containing protein [Streptomyces thermolilacinus]
MPQLLCYGAGRTVREPLLKRLAGVPSLVLVPMAELGLVPWHAARPAGRRRYACQYARISYVPSARLLCEVAARPATARPGAARQAPVVGNPAHDLPHAGEESRALHAEFHPGGLLLGPDEVTSLLMYMTHHHMSREGRSPGRALRTAQSWMLDERREAPPGMPAALLPRVRHIDATDPTGWPGFTHLGW